MIYTIGLKQLYEASFEKFKDNPTAFKKAGKNPYYPGGSVFKTYEDALQYKIKNNLYDCEVYGLMASWACTEPNDHLEFNNLLVDAQIIKLLK